MGNRWDISLEKSAVTTLLPRLQPGAVNQDVNRQY